MILTDDFVYVHQPKTGGTFVTDVIERLYGAGGPRGGLVNTDKHGTCSEVPASHRGKPMFTTIRNPYDRYVSQYRFAWWKRYPETYCGEAAMRDMFPHYPELSFAEFLELASTRFVNCHHGQETGYRNRQLTGERQLGWHTEQFVRFYCVRPTEVFARITEGYIAEGQCRHDLFPIQFLFSENLNDALYDLLRDIGHAEADLAFVRGAARIYPVEGGRASDDHWESYYTPALKQVVRTRERLLFQLFPHYDV